MRKILKFAVFAILLLAGFVTACNLSAAQPTVVPPEPTASATQTAMPLPTAVPTELLPLATPTSEFAPLCDAASASALPQCQFPIVDESSTFCSNKNPYNLILINKGMTYEVLTEGFRCADAGIKDDRQMLTCTGNMASYFEINVCDPACVVPTAQAEITKCPQGYNYNNLQGCCTNEIQLINRNCMVFKFKTTTCVVNCGEYNTQSTCNKNSYACLWDTQNSLCYARQ